MLGAIIGDIVGSRFERHNIKSKDFEFFSRSKGCRTTDDSIMTLAVAQAILDCEGRFKKLDKYAVDRMQEFGRKYPYAGYGGQFRRWIEEKRPRPYNSWGNGSAMRVSPCGYAAQTLSETISLSKAVTEVTHNHPEGIKGAEATAVAIYLARTGKSKAEIHDYIEDHYYKIRFTLDEIRATYQFDVSCQGSVPQALEAFFESTDFEDCIRNAISIGGDSDTIAAIAGGIAEAYYGIPKDIREIALYFLDEDQIEIVDNFESRYQTSPDKDSKADFPKKDLLFGESSDNKQDNVVCFHAPDEENGYLSNWFLSDFTLDGITFSSMEQYMMYQKAICFRDMEIASKILETKDVAVIKDLGRQVSGYDENTWNGMRQIIVYEGLLAKFSQNIDLKNQLLATGDADLAECAIKDRIWGIGLSMSDPGRFDKKRWKGQNLLGYALMLVRKKLR